MYTLLYCYVGCVTCVCVCFPLAYSEEYHIRLAYLRSNNTSPSFPVLVGDIRSPQFRACLDWHLQTVICINLILSKLILNKSRLISI